MLCGASKDSKLCVLLTDDKQYDIKSFLCVTSRDDPKTLTSGVLARATQSYAS